MPRKLTAVDKVENGDGLEQAPPQNPQIKEILVPAELAILEKVQILEQEIIDLKILLIKGFEQCGVNFNAPNPQTAQ